MKSSLENRFARLICLFIILAFSLSPAGGIRAAGPWYVSSNGNDNNTCTSPDSFCATINAAIVKANSGDTIYVAVGTYTHLGNHVVSLTKNVTVSGGWNEAFTTQIGVSTIDGQSARCGVTVSSDVTAEMDHFYIQKGSGRNCAGVGISARGYLILNHTVISDNYEYYLGGGGIYNDAGTVILNNSIVSRNIGYAGGIANYGTMTITHSIIENNMAYPGSPSDAGALLNQYYMTLSYSIVRGNQRGIQNWGVLTLNNTNISANLGVGISNGVILTLNNSTVSSNFGEGIHNEIGEVLLNNATISGNTTVGLYTNDSYSTVMIQNSLIAGNQTDCGGPITSLGYNLIGNTSDCTFTPGVGDQTNVDAHIGPLIGVPDKPMYHPLLSISPAINAGNPTGCTGSTGVLSADQRGAARVGRCDIGAYEYVAPGLADIIYAFSGTPQCTTLLSVFGMPLEVAVLDDIGSPVDNVVIEFTAPASGASGIFLNTGTSTTTVLSAEDGIATASPITANGSIGAFTVIATAEDVTSPANFMLTNNYSRIVLPLILR